MINQYIVNSNLDDIMDRKQIVLVGAVLAATLVFQFIILDSWIEKEETVANNYYNKGVQDGLQNAVVSILVNTEDCQTTIIEFNNQTRELVNVACVVLP